MLAGRVKVMSWRAYHQHLASLEASLVGKTSVIAGLERLSECVEVTCFSNRNGMEREECCLADCRKAESNRRQMGGPCICYYAEIPICICFFCMIYLWFGDRYDVQGQHNSFRLMRWTCLVFRMA